MGGECWQQVTPLKLKDRTLPLLFTSQHSYQGLRYSETPQGASFIASSVPCPGDVCSKTRLDFLDFADQCGIKFPKDHHHNVCMASQAQPHVCPLPTGWSRGSPGCSHSIPLPLWQSRFPSQHWEEGCWACSSALGPAWLLPPPCHHSLGNSPVPRQLPSRLGALKNSQLQHRLRRDR